MWILDDVGMQNLEVEASDFSGSTDWTLIYRWGDFHPTVPTLVEITATAISFTA
jgi:hypothetical protein